MPIVIAQATSHFPITSARLWPAVIYRHNALLGFSFEYTVPTKSQVAVQK